MNINQKKAIAAEVEWLAKKTSQKHVASKAQVSTALISNLLQGVWGQISDAMFRKIQNNLRLDLRWNVAVTANLTEVYSYCENAQKNALAICISDSAGKGKSNAYKYYERHNNNVILLECKSSWSKKSFLKNLLTAMGNSSAGTTEELLEQFNEGVKKLDEPLLILDQADKLKDPQLDLFMEFYNDHEGHLGIILSGVTALSVRIDRGRQRHKVGYDEIFSRLGSRYITLDPITLNDVAAICKANNVTETSDIEEIYLSSRGDLRRVRREIQKIQIANKKSAEQLTLV